MPLADGTGLSPRQALALGWKRCCVHGVFEAVGSFGSDKSRADGLQPSCRVGLAEKRNLDYERSYRKQNAEHLAARNRAWFAAHKGTRAEYDRLKREARLDHYRAVRRSHQKRNPTAYLEAVQRRTVATLRACPPWADHSAISQVYRTAAELTVETGIKHHVDHIIPLRGRNVCGLHIATNLRAIPAEENMLKSNKLMAVG